MQVSLSNAASLRISVPRSSFPANDGLWVLDIFALTQPFPSPLRFLDEVQSHCNENKMSVQNLATVFGPNILRPKMEDPVTIMEGAQLYLYLYLRLASLPRLSPIG